jgi:WD40 repeat protein
VRAAGAAADAAAANRAADARTLERRLQGDLDWITMKALAKERERRYATAAELAADLRRHLAHEAVLAGPPAMGYRLRKWTRRHRALVVGAASVLAVLLAGIVVASFFAVGQARARAQAEQLLAATNIERGLLHARAGNLEAAEDLLWREFLADPDALRPRWALWEMYSRLPCLVTFEAHPGSCHAAALSPDGSVLATASDDVVKTWETATFRCLWESRLPHGGVRVLTFSPDGGRLGIGCARGQLVVAAQGAGEPILSLSAAEPVDDVCFSPDGRLLAAAAGREVRVFDVDSGRDVESSPPQEGAVGCVRFDPGGGRLAAGIDTGAVVVWNTSATAVFGSAERRAPQRAAVRCLAFSRDGRALAWGGDVSRIHVWNFDANDIGEVPNSNVRARALGFSSDGRMLFAAGRWRIDAYELAGGQRARALPQRGGQSCAFSADGSVVAVGDALGTVRVWETEPYGAVSSLTSTRYSSAFGAAGAFVVSQGPGASVSLVEARTSRLLALFAGHRSTPTTFDVDAASTVALSAARDDVRVWDLTSGAPLRAFSGHFQRTSRSACLSHDGRKVAFTTRDGVLVHAIADGARLASYATPRGALGIAFSPDGAVLAVAMDDSVDLWSTASQERVAQLTARGRPHSVAFRPDGKLLAAGMWDNSVEVFDLRTEGRVARLRGHTATVWDVEFNPEAPHLLASSGADGTVRLWDVATERCLLLLDPFQGSSLGNVGWTPDGRTLAFASDTEPVRLLDTSYYWRHVALNLEHKLAKLQAEPASAARLRAWRAGVLATAWPRLGPRGREATSGAEAASVAAIDRWGQATLAAQPPRARRGTGR